VAAFLTAGYPSPERFEVVLREVAEVADVVEIGVPFSDPMADGVTIQESSRRALESGVTLRWILETIGRNSYAAPLVLMSYLNPLLAFGFERLAREAKACGFEGVIVPDLPYEECHPIRKVLDDFGLSLIQLVSPVTPTERLEKLCEASRGFVYAVATTGTTGGQSSSGAETLVYLDRVRAVSPLPVLAGFGIRSAEQVRAVALHADGVIVGSALVELLGRGESPTRFLRELTAYSQERKEEV
jgi:tryptophan synthase alpha chain